MTARQQYQEQKLGYTHIYLEINQHKCQFPCLNFGMGGRCVNKLPLSHYSKKYYLTY